MEITSARWWLEGGEAVLKLRALCINGDFDAYWDFHENQAYQHNQQAKFAQMPTARAPYNSSLEDDPDDKTGLAKKPHPF